MSLKRRTYPSLPVSNRWALYALLTHMKRILLYQICFEGIWCACVFGAAWGHPWLGPAAATLWIAFHLKRSTNRGREFALITFAGAFGLVADALLIRLGGLSYTGLPENAVFGPVWILALWMAFAISVNVSFTWLRGRALLASSLGIAGGLFSYACGRRLGVVEFSFDDYQTLLALCLVWGGGLPLLVHAAHRSESADVLFDRAVLARASLASWIGSHTRP